METLLKLELHGVARSDHLQALVATNLSRIEKRFGRATACRVVIRAPDAHHRDGEPYSVSVRIALPAGREVYAGRMPAADRRLADMTFAINDAFKRALRQLGDEAQQMQGRIKRRAPKPLD